MQVLLLQLLSYSTGHKGGPKANKLLLERLAARGHQCRALVPFSHERSADFQSAAHLKERGIPFETPDEGVIRFELNGVEVFGLETSFDPGALDFTKVLRMMENASELGRRFAPDVVLVSSDDFNNFMLETAFAIRPDRVVLLAHTIFEMMEVFGPFTKFPDVRRRELLGKCRGHIAPSRYLADFMREWGGLDVTILSFPAYGEPPFEVRSNFDQGFVTLISPNLQKGLPLFEQLTRALPEVRFGVVPRSITTSSELAIVESLPNVTKIPFSENIDDVLAKTRVLLVPSLGYENFPLVIVEAMLRGIPVLASDCGGIPEAKLGVEYLLPVRPMELRQLPPPERWDPTIPEQDPAPWSAAIRELLGDRGLYEDVARRSREAAHAFLDVAHPRHFEAFFESLGAPETPRT